MPCNLSEHGIAAEPLEVYAHRVILASGSDYFKGWPFPRQLHSASSRTRGLTEGYRNPVNPREGFASKRTSTTLRRENDVDGWSMYRFAGLFTTGASLRTVTTTVNSDGTSVQVVQLRETPWQPFLATLRYMYTAEASFDDGAAAFDVLHLAALYQVPRSP